MECQRDKGLERQGDVDRQGERKTEKETGRLVDSRTNTHMDEQNSFFYQ